MLARQLSLLDPPLSFDPAALLTPRQDLGQGAWIQHVPGFLRGHQRLFEQLYQAIDWRQPERLMYERVVDVPRLLGSLPEQGHPLVEQLAVLLSDHVDRKLLSISVALYRDGRDSVAWHGDRVAEPGDHVMATLSLGEPRRFLLRPKKPGPGRRSRRFDLGWGDLLLMGGTLQESFEHSVPKKAQALPRMVVMFRQLSG
jgi:alkylated DNA repair dioxygenase AlkB